jgi:integrase
LTVPELCPRFGGVEVRRFTDLGGRMPRQKAGRPRGTIASRGEGKWLVRVTLGTDAAGQRQRVNRLVRGTKADAQRELTRLLKTADEGSPVVLTKQTLDEWLVEYFEAWAGGLSKRSHGEYQAVLRRYLPRELRVRRLTALTPADLQQLFNELSARELAPRTVAYFRAILRRTLNEAVRLGRIARNPVPLTRAAKSVRREMHALSPDQARTFLATVADTTHEAFFTVLLTGGLRPSEALALRWSDFDADKLRVQRALHRHHGGGWSLDEPKTAKSRRTVVLPQSAVRALAKHRRRQVEERVRLGSEYADHGLIFASATGRPLDLPNLTVRHFKPLLEKAGLPSIRLYDLRHSAATLRLANGENPKVVSEMLGHSSIVLTLDTYSHVLPEMQAASAARLESLLFDRAAQ